MSRAEAVSSTATDAAPDILVLVEGSQWYEGAFLWLPSYLPRSECKQARCLRRSLCKADKRGVPLEALGLPC